MTILKDLGWKEETPSGEKIALLVDEKAGEETLLTAFDRAAALRAQGHTVTVQPLKKNAKFQVETLEKNGYTDIQKIFAPYSS